MPLPKLSELTLAHWLVIVGFIYFMMYFLITKYVVYHWFWFDLYDMTKVFLVVIAIVYTIGKLDLLKMRKN